MPWLNHASGHEHEIQLSGPGYDLWIVTALVESSRGLKTWNQKQLPRHTPSPWVHFAMNFGPETQTSYRRGGGLPPPMGHLGDKHRRLIGVTTSSSDDKGSQGAAGSSG